MPLYVFALVDRVPRDGAGAGIGGPVTFRKVAGAFAAVERRADVPPIEFGLLRKHQTVVSRLAARVPAILPVRFGTLVSPVELHELLDERDDELAEAFAYVRHRVQFTWRTRTKRRPVGPGPGAALIQSGTEYLRRAARSANPPVPAMFRPVRAQLRPLIAGEKYEPAAGTRGARLYHLVEARAAAEYAKRASHIQDARRTLAVSGPWPPFAFAPEAL
ncbi:MAG: GvpL/GvpF family gas vesicle protein [Vicinamibacterales bacterium]